MKTYMRIAILKRTPGIAMSMDVYAKNLIQSLSSLYPEVEIREIEPQPWWKDGNKSWKAGSGLKKYYERYYNHPRNAANVDADVYHILDHTDAHIVSQLKKAEKKVVVTCHDLVQFVYPNILKGQARWPLFSLNVWKYSVRGMRHADHVISVSDNTKYDVAKYLSIPLKKITTVPNAVNAEFRLVSSEQIQEFRSLYCRHADEICLLNVGSSHSRKNISVVLEVLNQLKNFDFPVRLWRIGGEFSSDQKDYIRTHHLGDFILDFGIVDNDKLIQIYNAADILLAPSLYEGFGLTILEAMACGLPVITSNCSSLPEVAGDAAIMIDPLAAEQIVDTVMKLMNQPEIYQELVKKGLLRAQQFSWKNTAKQVFKIYESIHSEFPHNG